MKYRSTPWIILLTVVFLLGSYTSHADAKVKKLVILHTSDEHSHLLGVGPESEDYPPSLLPGMSAYLKGGIARRATVFKQFRAQAKAEGAAVLTLSSGDIMMGTLAHVASTVVSPDFRAMRALGYDAAIFGNHDFELGPDFLARTIQTALTKSGRLFPIISSNIRFSGDPDQADALLASYMDKTGKDPQKPIHPWKLITTSNDIRVGLVGVMGVNASHYAPGKAPIQFSCAPWEEREPAKADICLSGLYRDTQAAVDELLNHQKADIVIVLAHAGTDPTNPSNGESYKIAQNVTGVDLVLSGHTHLLVPYESATNINTAEEVIITEPGCYGEYVVKIALTLDEKGHVTYDAPSSLVVPITNAIAADPSMQGIVDDSIRYMETAEDVQGKGSFCQRSVSEILGWPVTYESTLGSLYFYPLGKTAFTVVQKYIATETPMLRLVADAFLAEAKKHNQATDVALSASGFTRDSLWKGTTGAISLADVFRVLPLGKSPVDGTLGHPLTLVGLYGDELKALMEATSLSYLKEDLVDYYTEPAGMCVEFDPSKAPSSITKIRYSAASDNNACTGKVIYEAAKGGWQGDYQSKLYVVALDLYHIAFGFPSMKLPLRPPDGKPTSSVQDVILKRASGNEVKSFEALGSYIKAQCDANGGYIPVVYNDQSPLRNFCMGPLCGSDVPVSHGNALSSKNVDGNALQ